MPPFHFGLENIARLRVVQRDVHRDRLSDACRLVQQLEDQLRAVQEQLRCLRQTARGAATCGRLDSDFLCRTSEFQGRLRDRQRELDAQWQAARQRVEQCRAELVQAEQHVKTLDRLRERQQIAHRRHAAVRETLDHDELARQRAGGHEWGVSEKEAFGCS